MLVLEKKQAVLDFVKSRQMCATRDIIDTLGIPKVTAYRLLAALEDEQLVEKFHGGVRVRVTSVGHRDFDRRLTENTKAKAEIARRAVQLVQPGATLFIDASTTCLHLGRLLARPDGAACTVVTDSPLLINELCGCTHLRVVSTGGELDHQLNLLGGALAIESIGKLNFSDAFVSAGGASLQHGATTAESEIVATLRMAKARASRTYLLVDAEKFVKVAPHTIAPLCEFTAVVTDSGLAKNARAQLVAAGVKLLE